VKNELQTAQTGALTHGAMGSVEANRAIAQVQAQVMMAKQFPRNQIEARSNILEACKRIRLAETAIYSYPRGGSRVEGPSIRLAEMIAQYWGNIDCGIIELETKPEVGGKPGESLVTAFCVDYQTNARRQITFTIPHVRSKRGGNKNLNDPRDVYEMVANMATRRLRACILAIIPGDIIEEAVEQCNKTLRGASDKPLIDRVKDMTEAFKKLGVSQQNLEEHLGHKMEACLETEIVQLRKIYKSLQDGMSKPEDWFQSATDAKPVSFNGMTGEGAKVEAPKKKSAPKNMKKSEPPPKSKKIPEACAELAAYMKDKSCEKVVDAVLDERGEDGEIIAEAIEKGNEEACKKTLDAIKAALAEADDKPGMP
jgi:hypothetical protein